MDKEDPASGSSQNVATVPGQSGSGTGANNHADDTAGDSSSGSTPSATGSSDGATTTGEDTGNTFSQGGGASTSKTGSAGRLGAQETVLQGSLFAGVIAVVAMMVL